MNLVVFHLKKIDWAMVLAAAALVIFGLVSISSGSSRSGDFLNFNKQAIFFGIGFFIFLAASFFDWRNFRESSALILALYFFSIAGLVGLYFFGSANRGVRTWYDLGFATIDPIEWLKPALLLLLAKYFSWRYAAMYQIRHIFLTGFYVGVPLALIFFQPNLGLCLVIAAFWLGMLVVAGIRAKHLLAIAVCFLAFLAAGWLFFLQDYQKNRILSFFNGYDPLGVSWSQNQARIALGTGGLLGKGFGNGPQTQYGFLSEPQTDFIFSAIGEEFGILGIAAILALLLFLIGRLTKAAIAAPDNFSRLFLAGLAILIFAEAAIHIGVNVGFLPIIGLPLPLVSYGGSNLIATFALLGVAQSIIVSSRASIIEK